MSLRQRLVSTQLQVLWLRKTELHGGAVVGIPASAVGVQTKGGEGMGAGIVAGRRGGSNQKTAVE